MTLLQCSLDGAPFTTCTSPFATGALTDGPHTFSAKASDNATNSTTITTTWTLDTVGPTFMITSSPPANTNATNPSTSFTTAADATTIDCQINSGAFATCTSPFAPALAEGTNYTITVREKGPLFMIYPFDSDAALRNPLYYSRAVWQLKSIDVL